MDFPIKKTVTNVITAIADFFLRQLQHNYMVIFHQIKFKRDREGTKIKNVNDNQKKSLVNCIKPNE